MDRIDAATAVHALEAHADYRVLRRLVVETGGTGMVPRKDDDGAAKTWVGIALDTETTGKDAKTCKVTELAMRRFRFDRRGMMIEIGRPRSWLEDPGEPISAEVTRITGLTDRDVAGHRIDDDAATDMLVRADCVLAHNAAFDRKVVERRLKHARGLNWACTLEHVDWARRGFECRKLGDLLLRTGYFHGSHRAAADVDALIHLLQVGVMEGDSVLLEVVMRALEPATVVRAFGAPFDRKDVMKERGFRWDGDRRVWWREVLDVELDDEKAWLDEVVYDGARPGAKPHYQKITWRERYA
jgi:DNA polymerase III subunit epsilon